MRLDNHKKGRVLVAGVGNIFLGDDAFGCEVVAALSRRTLPEAVRVEDFGIRSFDLAYALAEQYEAVILVDATPRGQPPGSLCLLEPEVEPLPASTLEAGAGWGDAHSLHPVKILQLARALGPGPGRLYLVGCEPGAVEFEDGRMGLSDAVRAAVPKALELIESLLGRLLGLEKQSGADLVPAA
jgi:hydrogenase maturation protease